MEISEKHKHLLDDIFYNEKGEQGAFGTVKPIYNEAKRRDPTVTFKIIRQYLSSIAPYLLHKRALRKFKRRSMLVLYPGYIFAADLVFYQKDKSVANLQSSYCLNVIDCFSKMGFSKPLVNKSASQCLKAFKEILVEAKMVPRFLFVDEGEHIFNKCVGSVIVNNV